MEDTILEMGDGYVEYRPIPNLDISELKELDCVKPIDNDSQLIVHCEPQRRFYGLCPKCNDSESFYVHGRAADRTVHDISRGIINILLKVKVPRYKCNECGAAFSYPFRSLIPGQQFTKRLYDQLKVRVLKEPFKVVATEYGISETKAADILDEYSLELFRDRKVIAPKVLGIDEKHIVNEKRGVLVDVELGVLLEMTPDNLKDTIQTAIESLEDYDKNIKVVTIDMWTPYVSAIQECLPHAVIVVDRFHVVQNIYRKIERTRKKLFAKLKEQVNELPDGEEKEYKRELLTRLGKNVFLFRFNREHLDEVETRSSLMRELCEVFPELNKLRLLKEGLERIYDVDNRAEAEAYYEEWITLIPPKEETIYSEIHTLKRSMKKWSKYIFSYFDEGCKYTNAATEGVNSFIDKINDLGRGYGFEALRIKSLFNSVQKLKPKPNQKVKSYNFASNMTDVTQIGTAGKTEYLSGGGTKIEKLNKKFDKIF